MIRVLGIDPGGTTGLADITYWPISQELRDISPSEITGGNVLAVIGSLLSLQRPDLVAVEKFVVSRRSGRSSTAQAGEQARLIIGGVARLCQEHGVRFVQRPAGIVKPWATDRRLDAAGLLAPTKGMGHARDAARHALYAAVRDLGLPDPLSRKDRT
jgi:hypothetical protein